MAKRGRTYKPTEADRVFVDRAVMAGSRINDIADALGLTDDTLRKHFRYEIMSARERLKSDAVRVLAANLADDNLDAAKFVLSRVAKWSENLNVHQDDDAPPPLTINIGTSEARGSVRVTKKGDDD